MPIELTDREREEDIIELASEKPKIHALTEAVNQALTDLGILYDRWDNCYDYWHAQWENQTADGCKHPGAEDMDDPFPWDGASDIRPRECEKLVRRHVMVAKLGLRNAKLQATTEQAGSFGREVSHGTKLLKWITGTHMLGNILREQSLALTWRFAYGLALVAVEQYQEERLDEHEVTLPVLDMFIQASGGPPSMVRIMETIMDPTWEENYIELLMRMSDVVTRRDARHLLFQLRTEKRAMMPVRYTYESCPRLTAKRPGVDVLFPWQLRDLQCAPWIADREWLTRPQLLERMRTRNYDPMFVRELLKHQGETSNALWTGRTMAERDYYGTGRLQGSPGWSAQFRGMYELFHVRYKASHRGTTCMYETVFNPTAIGSDRANPLYALHEKFNYDHGLYPYVALRAETTTAELVASEGIPEKAYTWERGQKVQLDGNTDLTALELGPPLIVPKSRQNTLDGYPLPRSVLGVDRASDYQFMNLPAPGQRSTRILQEFRLMAAEFFPLFDLPGLPLDPALKQAYREELLGDTLGEWTLVYQQVFFLLQQFEADEDVQAVVGPLRRPFKVDKRAIQQQHTIRITYDARRLDEEFMSKVLPMAQMAMSMDTTGRYDMSELAEIALDWVDPSIVDRVSRPPQQAEEMEMRDELSAINSAFNGLEVPPPMHANHELRAKVIMQAVFQSQNPAMAKRLADNPDTAEILKKRLEFHQNQVQQHSPQGNPGIGRALATSAFNPRQALPTTAQPAGGGY